MISCDLMTYHRQSSGSGRKSLNKSLSTSSVSSPKEQLKLKVVSFGLIHVGCYDVVAMSSLWCHSEGYECFCSWYHGNSEVYRQDRLCGWYVAGGGVQIICWASQWDGEGKNIFFMVRGRPCSFLMLQLSL